MMSKNTTWGVVFVVLMSCGVHAGMVNSGFESGLTGWTVPAGGQVSPFTDVAGSYALFNEAGGPGTPAVSSVYQEVVLGPSDVSLSFAYMLYTSGEFVGHGALPDAFTARVLDPVTLHPLVSTPGVNDYFYHDARGAADSIDFDDMLVTRVSTASRPDWYTVNLDLSSLAAGTPVRVQFDLLGTGSADGQSTFAGVDNVFVVPEPSALLLLLPGLYTLCLPKLVHPKNAIRCPPRRGHLAFSGHEGPAFRADDLRTGPVVS